MARYFSKLLALTLGLFLSTNLLAQTQTLSGRISDSVTGEYVIGANVIIEGLNKGVSTNIYGFYSIQVPQGDISVIYSFIGYNNVVKKINVTEATTLNIDLSPSTIEIEGAEVVGSITENTKSADLGRANVNVATIKKLPALMGEVDVLKVIQLLPGRHLIEDLYVSSSGCWLVNVFHIQIKHNFCWLHVFM